jgi:hypothetical protein
LREELGGPANGVAVWASEEGVNQVSLPFHVVDIVAWREGGREGGRERTTGEEGANQVSLPFHVVDIVA